MPLLPGQDPSIVSHNITELVKAGHPHDQAVAAALHNAGMKHSRRAKKLIDLHNQATAPNPALGKYDPAS